MEFKNYEDLKMEGHDFLTAHFVNNERTVVEVFWVTPDGKETREEYIEANDDDTWKNLLKHVTIDELHENTYKHIREQNKLFEDQVITIAKKRGMVYDIDEVNTDVYKSMVSAIFKPFDPEEQKDKLFMIKLALFEVESIKNVKNKELKSELRKANDIISAFKIAIQMVESTSEPN